MRNWDAARVTRMVPDGHITDFHNFRLPTIETSVPIL